MPNWQAVQDTTTAHESITETPQDVDSRNLKEIAMLKQNLGGDSDIPAHEILYDANQLRSLVISREKKIIILTFF